MKQMQVFLVDDIINIVYKEKVIRKRLKNILLKGNIIDKNRFMEEFIAILKKEKIKSKLFGDNIIFIKNSYYQVSDLFFLENIFLELGFLKVIFWDINELLSDEEATYIEINNTYMVVYLDKGVLIDLEYFKDIPGILRYLDGKFKENIYLFGNNKLIPDIKILNKNVYYFEDYDNYIVNKMLKGRICDV